ncbi:MAG TPA: ATP synthase F1 subunit delta [Terriglobales bacterium]|nr:ATP synthase F1 subunit delta [Terriglobales bacterium]
MASVTSRYARAFADVVLDLKLDVAKVREELRSIVDLVSTNPSLRTVWESPAISHEQKLGLLDAIAARMGLVTAVRNLIAVVIDHGRIAMLPQIARQFEGELNSRLGLAEAKITSARELSAEERLALEMQIVQMTGKQVIAQYATDTNLLGGAVVKIGSTIYDGSVRGQLRKMKEELSAH